MEESNREVEEGNTGIRGKEERLAVVYAGHLKRGSGMLGFAYPMPSGTPERGIPREETRAPMDPADPNRNGLEKRTADKYQECNLIEHQSIVQKDNAFTSSRLIWISSRYGGD